MKALVAYASKHGATEGIAEAIASGLSKDGVEAGALDLDKTSDLGGHDAVVLGSAVYAGHWLKPAREFALDHQDELRGLPVWLFSSGPCGPPDDLIPEGDPVDIAALTEALRPVGHQVFAGMIDKSKLGFAERALVSALHVPLGDFRDWDAIAAFASGIAGRLDNPRVG